MYFETHMSVLKGVVEFKPYAVGSHHESRKMLKVTVDIVSLVHSSHCKRKVIVRDFSKCSSSRSY